jgi:hypothetical protein
MDISILLNEIKKYSIETFNKIDSWFDKQEVIREYKPRNGGWSINQVLEHIGLTNHFLLILIDKGANKALQNISKFDLENELANYIFHRDKLTEVGLHQSFNWIRPEHMEPKGEKSLSEVRAQLTEQLEKCLNYLELLKNGEGVLYKTTMSVNSLGKIDVYEYIYFLAQHGNRHITQMEKNESEYRNLEKPIA